MLVFGKKGTDGYHHSECGEYVIWIQRRAEGEPVSWAAAKWPIQHNERGVAMWLGDGFDFDTARWACEDDKFRYPCGCVLTVRPNWWKHCPKCGALLPEARPYVPPPPKVKRKKKVPNRPAWLEKRSRGSEHGHEWDCVYEGLDWALVRIPGYTGWVSLGTSAYGPTTYEAMRKDGHQGMCVTEKETAGVTSALSIKRFAKDTKSFQQLHLHTGRPTKDDLTRMRGIIDELDARGA